jgi:hypothetical protein
MDLEMIHAKTSKKYLRMVNAATYKKLDCTECVYDII